ncbi:RHS repeat-associated core domain-containing protein [Xylophilus ampelinus]|uniref:RHS repeat-associated core domain-containing protein n=1 Tax=Xylophilus ampelinus TaxID=54067 RepID=UPI00216AFE98|nr:RHS repeat-associated core domain-containing protein [Xylophilus ampelinus]MCS4508716.1 DUF6531 domain-containing protein [Xylophilus ampelinus]
MAEYDAPAAHASVSIFLKKDGNIESSYAGVTDGQGKFQFKYVPPQVPTKIVLESLCGGCTNISTNTIEVLANQICDANSPPLENPIQIATGEKLEADSDWIDRSPHPLSFGRFYYGFGDLAAARMGGKWAHQYYGKLELDAAKKRATIRLGERPPVVFTRSDDSGSWINIAGRESLTESLEIVENGAKWLLKIPQKEWQFSADGKLIYIVDIPGKCRMKLYYDGEFIAKVENEFGRSINFSYGASGLLEGVVFPDGTTSRYEYDDQSRLVKVVQTDGTIKRYKYDDANHPSLMTGKVDENSLDYAKFEYDYFGRAIRSEHAGGAHLISASYTSLASGAGRLIGLAENSLPEEHKLAARVQDALGMSRNYEWFGGDSIYLSSLSATNGISSLGSRNFDTDGLPQSEHDFLGTGTTYTWDFNRRLPLATTRAAGRPEAATVAIQWHPTFDLPALITQAGRTTAFTYDASGRKLSESVTDMGTGQSATQSWSYNDAGLVSMAITANGAATGYTYDIAGNLDQSTDPLGRITLYEHDAAGRMTRQTDPTGTASIYTYDPRGRLLTQSRGGLQITSIYTPTGLVSRIVSAAGYAVDFTYDDAHRLTGWNDNRGASGSYTLDGMGNRTAEKTRDARNQVIWQATRTINYLNSVVYERHGDDQGISYTYDANGERISETNALGQTTRYGLDGLRRVQQVTDSLNAQAMLAYDPRDNVVAASDFKGVSTAYTRDALGSATQERSADTGALATTYDALGLPRKIVDALGRATEITRDVLGRPTRIQYADGSASVLRYDLAGADYAEADSPNACVGFLGELQDPGVTTRYRRDALGRVTRKQQVLADGANRSVAYGYGAAGAPGAGRIASITYPSGGVLGYVYDATGQLAGLSLNGTPLVSDLAWNPLGQPTGWQWPFVNGGTSSSSGGLAASRRYDTAGQLVQYELGSYTWDAAGRVASLTQELMLPTAGGVAPTVFSTGFTYDGAGRIVGMAHEPRTVASLPSEVPLSAVVGPQQVGMAYDANGNRQSVVYTQGASDSGLTLQRTYTVAPDSNRPTGYAQTLRMGTGDPTVTQVPFVYDATGSITQAGRDVWGYGADGRLRSVERSGGTSSTDTMARATYLHNALGQRVLKTNGLQTPAVRTETVYAEGPFEGSTVLGQYRNSADGSTSGTGTTEFIYLPTAGGPMPIAAVMDGRLYAVHSDHLNTPRRLTRDDGLVTWQWVTTAFGEVPPSTSATEFVQDAAVASSGVAPSSSAATPFAFDLRYPGQVADEESGLFYNLNRSYHPLAGRYTQNDPIGLEGGVESVWVCGGGILSVELTHLGWILWF